MKRTLLIFSIVLMSFLGLSTANADTISYTGEWGSGGTTGLYSPYYSGRINNVGHYFEISPSDYLGATITSIHGWFYRNYDSMTGWARILLYEDGGSGNSLGGLLYTSPSFAIPSWLTENVWAWRGVSGLNWDLDPGEYWAVIEALTISYPYSVYRGTIGGNPSLYYTSTTGWVYDGIGDIGINIQGDLTSAPVPEPATLLLLGSGLAGLAGFRRRFRKR